jgi:hypothetical protein
MPNWLYFLGGLIGAIGTFIGYLVIISLIVLFVWSIFTEKESNENSPDDGSSAGGGSLF